MAEDARSIETPPKDPRVIGGGSILCDDFDSYKIAIAFGQIEVSWRSK